MTLNAGLEPQALCRRTYRVSEEIYEVIEVEKKSRGEGKSPRLDCNASC
jgi:hypothetical protein